MFPEAITIRYAKRRGLMPPTSHLPRAAGDRAKRSSIRARFVDNSFRLPRTRIGRPEENSVCPFVDKSDVRCATHLTLANLARAFAHCADEYTVCPIYAQLQRELVSHGREHREPAVAACLLAAS
jgi:hypothetical protein